MTTQPTPEARDLDRDEAYYLAALIDSLRNEFVKIFDAANEVLACLEHEDYEAAEQVTRYIKLKAMSHAPQANPSPAAPAADAGEPSRGVTADE